MKKVISVIYPFIIVFGAHAIGYYLGVGGNIIGATAIMSSITLNAVLIATLRGLYLDNEYYKSLIESLEEEKEVVE